MTVEYEVTNTRIFRAFLIKEIGTEFEVNSNKMDFGGYVTVYDLTNKEREKINSFLNGNNLKK